MRVRAVAALCAVVAVVVVIACNRSTSGSPTTASGVPQAGSGAITASATDLYISTEDRIWWKAHVPKFYANGTIIGVNGTNPWDHPIQQGHLHTVWLKIFDKTKVPQEFIAQVGPITIGPKDFFSLSVDIGYGYCFVEAELRLDTADNKLNGGNPSYLFGVADLEIGDCHRPTRPRPSPSPSPSPTPCPELTASGEADPCVPPPQCEEEWVAQEPEVDLGEFGECSAVLDGCVRSRTDTVTTYEVNSCTQERRVKGEPTFVVTTEPCECPPPPNPEFCIYNVSGNPALKFVRCLANGGQPFFDNGVSHCRVPFPGISDDNFNLTPGQSSTGCLRKQDDD